MDECAICEQPDEEPFYIETEHLNPEDRRSFAICRNCAWNILDTISARLSDEWFH